MRNSTLNKVFLLIVLALMLISASAVNNPIYGGSDKAFMGIYPADLDDEAREALDFKGKGILIQDIVENGPAEKAGIEAGDILIKLDGKKVLSTKILHKILSKKNPDDKVEVIINRNGDDKKIQLILGEPFLKISSLGINDIGKNGGFLGIIGETIKGQFAEYFKVKSGVLIKEVVEDSPAEEAGIKAGDVIVKIDDESIDDMKDLHQILEECEPEQKVTVHIKRNGGEIIVTAELDEAASGYHFKHSFDELNLNFEGIGDAVRHALDNIYIYTDKDDLREELEELKKELKELKKEIQKAKKKKKKK